MMKKTLFVAVSALLMLGSCTHSPSAMDPSTANIPELFLSLNKVAVRTYKSFGTATIKNASRTETTSIYIYALPPDRFRMDIMDPIGRLLYSFIATEQSLTLYNHTKKALETETNTVDQVKKWLGIGFSTQQIIQLLTHPLSFMSPTSTKALTMNASLGLFSHNSNYDALAILNDDLSALTKFDLQTTSKDALISASITHFTSDGLPDQWSYMEPAAQHTITIQLRKVIVNDVVSETLFENHF